MINQRKAVFIIIILFFRLCPINAAPGDTLAIIGPKVITTDSFIKLYSEKLTKLGLTDNGEVRMKYLMNLVSDEVLIQEAKSEKLDRTPEALKEFKRQELQELLNTYSLKHISPEIRITDADLKTLYVKFNTRLKVSHLFAEIKAGADNLYVRLKKGEKFEELAKETFRDPKLRDNGGSLGYISIDEMDPEFERAAYSLKTGEVSSPVKTVEGYSIIRLEDIKPNPLLTENEFLKAKERLKTFARKRAYEEEVKRFTANLRNKLKIHFNEAMISKLYEAMNGKPLQEIIEGNVLSASKEDVKKTVVSSALGNWDFKTLVSEMKVITEGQRKWIRTRDNLEDFISGLVMRKYISSEARKEKLHLESSFSKNVRYAFDTYLLNSIEQRIKAEIKISPDSIRAYYNKNIELFKTEPEVRLRSILLDNAGAADSVKNLLEKGMDFSVLARKFSIQKVTGEEGGDIGFFKKKMLGELSDELFRLNVGEWTGPVKDDGKYAFLQCSEIKASQIRTFESCQKEIEEMLSNIKWFEIRKNYVDSFRSRLSIKLFFQKLNVLKI